MKRFTKFALSVFVVALILGLSFLLADINADMDIIPAASAAKIVQSGSCGENLTYTLDSNNTLTISGTGSIEKYNWPILSEWHDEGETYIEYFPIDVIISEGITSIGDSAFSGYENLDSVTIPDSVTSIGSSAFEGCSRLRSIVIPDSVTSIGARAFRASELDSITIGDGVTSIGANAFFADFYESFSRPDVSVHIKDLAKWLAIVFENGDSNPCSADLYLNGEKVTNVIIPDSVTSIGNYAFYSCSSLQSIIIPDSVTSIGNSAFYDCINLQSITIPDSVTSIGNYAFYSCSSLQSITIPDSVTSIGDYAFSFCNIQSITIGNGVTSIGENAFSETEFLRSVYIKDLAKWLAIDFGDEDAQPLFGADLYLNGEKLTDVIIPDSVTSIGDYAFRGCSSLQSVTIPDSVTSIGDGAFSSCSSLQSITIPDSVTSIGDYAFRGCSSLQSITIPDSVTSIGDEAFSYCSIQSITIGNGVTSIGEDAFSEIAFLQSVYIKDLAKWLAIDFNNYYSNPLCNTADLYLNDEKVTDVIIPAFVTSIGNYAFYNYDSLQSITIPDSVTSIGMSAFRACSSLQSVTVGGGIERIEEGTFYNCSSLQSIIIPDSVTSIGMSAFRGCSSLQSATVGDGIERIEEGTFYNCSSLQSITIPDSVTSIGRRAFYDCSSLSDVYYEGSMIQWYKIDIASDNKPLTKAKKHYNSHVHSYEITITAPTCTEKGYTTYTCACGDTYKYNEVNAIRHTYTSKITKQPTATEEGIETFTCACGDSYTRTIAKFTASFTDSNDAKVNGSDVISNNGLTVAQLLSQTGGGAVIKTADGKAVSEKDLIGTGMILVLVDGSTKEIVVYGDADGDGKISAADARKALRASVNLENLGKDSCYFKAANVDNGVLTAADARLILRASVNLENPKAWLK